MSVAVLVPSLNRPQLLARLIANIHATTKIEHRILFAVSDDESKEILTKRGEWFLDDSDDPDKRYVTRMNKLVRFVHEGRIFFGSDDVIHHPGWDTLAEAVLDTGFHVAVVNDLHNSNGTQAMIERAHLEHAVFDSPGDAFHGGYLHNFADNEQFFTAYMRNEYARAMDSVVEHLHPLFGSGNALPWDSTYEVAAKGWDHDQALFEERIRMIETALA